MRLRKKDLIITIKKNARYFFVVKNKKEIILEGPFLKDIENNKAFKKEHKKTFIKNKRIYAKEKINYNLKEFMLNWKNKYNKKLQEMSILDLKII